MVEFTFTPVPEKGRKPGSDFERLAHALATVRGTLPIEMRTTVEIKCQEIIEELERDQPDLKGAFYYRIIPERLDTAGEIRVHEDKQRIVAIREWGRPGIAGARALQIMYFPPGPARERVLNDLLAAHDAWVAAGKYKGTGRRDPLSKAAERKLRTEGKLFRYGDIKELPPKQFVERVVIDNMKDRIRDNFAKAIQNTFAKALRGLG